MNFSEIDKRLYFVLAASLAINACDGQGRGSTEFPSGNVTTDTNGSSFFPDVVLGDDFVLGGDAGEFPFECTASFDCVDKITLKPCMKPSCDNGVCVLIPADGTACDDGNACTASDQCTGGVCAGTNTCACQSDADCTALDDADLCNGVLRCAQGGCATDPSTIVTCTGGSTCLPEVCIPETGLCDAKPAADGVPCDDFDPCTAGDACNAGTCTGTTAGVCEDDNPCTADKCSKEAGCTHIPATGPCDDGIACTTGDVCNNGTCMGDWASCPCSSDEDCPSQADGDLCSGTLFCDTTSTPAVCKLDLGSIVQCPPSENPCQQSACDPKTGLCTPSAVPDGNPCDDGNLCTTNDKCSAGICTSSDPTLCDDQNPCTDDTCSPSEGCQHITNTMPCDDETACTVSDTCAGGTCVGTSIQDCDDGNPCT
ncbi:MAG: hypothetical protein HUU55_12790, partial [Myxococcales bacterium]|nr:hypothetical protein [Myxococcales bacterium]